MAVDKQTLGAARTHVIETLQKNESYTKIKTINVPAELIYSDTTGQTPGKISLMSNDNVKVADFYIKETFFTENSINPNKLLNIRIGGMGLQGGYLCNIGRYGITDIWEPSRVPINGADSINYYKIQVTIFALNGNSSDTSTTFTASEIVLRYEV